jgi:Rod binding domain-containing protein
MNIPSLNNSEMLNSQPIENTKKFIDLPDNLQSVNSQANSKNEEIKKAAEGFEAIFLNMMMKEMKMPLAGDGNNVLGANGSDNFGANTLQSYFSMLFAEQMAKNGNGIGIANLIYKQLTGEDLKQSTEQFSSLETIQKNNKETKSTNTNNLNTPSIKLNTENQSQSDNKINGNFLERVLNRLSNYDDTISNASATQQIPKELIQAVITAESAGRSDAISKAGAKGLMQLMDGTARSLNVNNSFDPEQNIHGGTKYLRQMLDRFDNNVQLALAAYNAGPGNVEKYNGIPPFEETQNYVKRVMRYYQYFTNNNEGDNI